jgi:uncharacterized protein (TIGR03083 family)
VPVPWDHARQCELLADELARSVATLAGAELSRPVPTCPGWDVAELVRHVGSVHRWAASMVRAGARERFRLADLDLELPTDDRGLGAWLAAGGEALVATLRRADPDAPMWAWGADQHVRFWPRRMVHETTVHRADAQLALGVAVDVDAEIARDGVDELLENLPHARPFAPRVEELRGDGESLSFDAGDIGARWVVALAPSGFTWSHAGDGDVSVRVQAAARDVLLLLYGRLPATDPRVTIEGDDAVLARWLECSAL